MIPLKLSSDPGLVCGLHGHLTHPYIFPNQPLKSRDFLGQFFDMALVLPWDLTGYATFSPFIHAMRAYVDVYVKMPSQDFASFGTRLR